MRASPQQQGLCLPRFAKEAYLYGNAPLHALRHGKCLEANGSLMNIMLIKLIFENEAASLYYLQVDKQAP